MTLAEFKNVCKGRQLFVWVNWQQQDGTYIRVTAQSFLTSIGADVAYDRGGLHGDTAIDARVDGRSVYVC